MEKRVLKVSYLRLFLVIVILVFLVLLLWLNFFSQENCKDSNCFSKALQSCNRANFVNSDKMTFKYNILGREKDNCVVDVRLLKGDISNKDSLELEGKQMSCYLPLGVLMQPEDDISNCHGLLKEGLQDLVITKLHEYIVQNLGKIHAQALGIN